MYLTFNIEPHLVIQNSNTEVNKPLINETFHFNCPDKLLYFWKEYEQILFDNSISIYGYSMALERNIQYEINEYLDDFIMVGDDGGGRGLFIEKEDTFLLLYYLDLGAVGSMDLLPTNQNLFEWIEQNPDLEQYEDVSEDDILYEKSELFIVKIPEKKNQFLFKLKKLLHIEDSIVTLSKGMDNLPVLIKENFFPIKYKKEISELNNLYQCLELRTKDGIIISVENK